MTAAVVHYGGGEDPDPTWPCLIGPRQTSESLPFTVQHLLPGRQRTEILHSRGDEPLGGNAL